MVNVNNDNVVNRASEFPARAVQNQFAGIVSIADGAEGRIAASHATDPVVLDNGDVDCTERVQGFEQGTLARGTGNRGSAGIECPDVDCQGAKLETNGALKATELLNASGDMSSAALYGKATGCVQSQEDRAITVQYSGENKIAGTSHGNQLAVAASKLEATVPLTDTGDQICNGQAGQVIHLSGISAAATPKKGLELRNDAEGKGLDTVNKAAKATVDRTADMSRTSMVKGAGHVHNTNAGGWTVVHRQNASPNIWNAPVSDPKDMVLVDDPKAVEVIGEFAADSSQ